VVLINGDPSLPNLEGGGQLIRLAPESLLKEEDGEDLWDEVDETIGVLWFLKEFEEDSIVCRTFSSSRSSTSLMSSKESKGEEETDGWGCG